MMLFFLVFVMLALVVEGFRVGSSNSRSSRFSALATTMMSDSESLPTKNQVGKTCTLAVPLGEGYKDLTVTFRPIFAKSMFFVVSYQVPFGLSVERPPKGFPAPLVTKDGPGGEKLGDVLRACTCWSQGFNAAGATSDIMSFAGNVKWRRSMFDTTGASWEQTVQALTSNTAERSKEVALVFERELPEDGTGGESNMDA